MSGGCKIRWQESLGKETKDGSLLRYIDYWRPRVIEIEFRLIKNRITDPNTHFHLIIYHRSTSRNEIMQRRVPFPVDAPYLKPRPGSTRFDEPNPVFAKVKISAERVQQVTDYLQRKEVIAMRFRPSKSGAAIVILSALLTGCLLTTGRYHAAAFFVHLGVIIIFIEYLQFWVKRDEALNPEKYRAYRYYLGREKNKRHEHAFTHAFLIMGIVLGAVFMLSGHYEPGLFLMFIGLCPFVSDILTRSSA